MANNLRKYKFTPGNKTTEETSPEKANKAPGPTHPVGDSTSKMSGKGELQDLKTELLSFMKIEMTELFQREVTKVITHEIEGIKAELQSVKTEIANSTVALRIDMETVKTTVVEMEGALSVHSDDITTLQTKVQTLEKIVESLREKHVDLEGRSRRSNIRILNVAESSPCTPVAVSKLIRDVLKLDRDVLVDRSHRSLQGKRADGKPRPIIAKLHYPQDCVDILRRARESDPLQRNGSTILIFPDYPPSVARARMAFNDVKKSLRGREGVRYGLLYPARLRISHDGKDMIFNDPAKAQAYVKVMKTPILRFEGAARVEG